MLLNAELPKTIWPEAISTACFLINRLSSIAIEKKTLEEVWIGSPLDYLDLMIFGCSAFAHLDN